MQVVALSIIACQQEVPINKDKQLADSIIAEVNKAFNSGDFNQMLNLYADDAIAINSGVKFCGKDSITKVRKELYPSLKNYTITNGISSVSGDLVYCQGLETFDWQQGNYSAFCKGFYTTIWKKQPDASCKITFSIEDHGDLIKNK